MKNRITVSNTDIKPDGGLQKKGLRIFMTIISVIALTVCMSVMVMADGEDPIAVVNNLSTFIFGLIRAVGIIILVWGIVQVGMSFQSHDPSQRSQGFLTLAGGLVITLSKEILGLMGVS